MGDPTITVRLNDDGSLDEVCGRGHFHLEQMSDGAWWMRLDADDGTAVVVDLTARGKIKATWERDQ